MSILAPEGFSKTHHDPERMCLVTREHGTQDTLTRFVAGPNGDVVPDLKAKLPGRGVWVTTRKDILAKAVQRKLFARGFKREVVTPADLVDKVEAQLRRDVLGALSLANKAGCVVSGLAKVESALRAGKVRALILAQEGQDTGAGRLVDSAHPSPEIIIVNLLANDELSLALGKPHVIHAACLRQEGAHGFVRAWQRFEHFMRFEEPRLSPSGGF
jgi:uncharacterized protein